MKVETMPMEQLAQLLELQLENGEAPLRVTGSSMYPTFRSGRDTVFLRKPDAPLRKGDVILYRRQNGRYVLHRIVRIKDGVLICSGDNQFEPERVEPEQVIARVEAFQRGKRKYKASHFGYRIYVWFWIGVFPVRRPMLKFRRCLGKGRRKLSRLLKNN